MLNKLTLAKKTGTYADVLVAVGLADLIYSCSERTLGRRVVIKDCGESHVLDIKPGIDLAEVLQWQIIPGYPYIKVKKDDADVPQVGEIIDYEEQKELDKLYRAYQKKLSNSAKKVTESQGIEPDPPRSDLQVIKIYNSMRMGSNTYNQLHKVIRDFTQINQVVAWRLGLQAKPEVNTKVLEKAVTTLQLFNPVSGKGIHRTKPDSTELTGYPNQLVDWFEEWMKFRAIHLTLVAYYTGGEGKDIKVLVLDPGDISIDALSDIRKKLLAAKLWGKTPTTLDIHNALAVAEALITNSEEYLKTAAKIKLLKRTANQIIKGLFNTYFKNLGTASAVMNVSFIGIPGWFPIQNREDAVDWLDILKEHKRCIQSLDEKHSDDMAVLIAYRDFISTNGISEGLEFYARYAAHFMESKGQGKWAEPFTVHNVRRLFMGLSGNTPIIKDIITNKGFINIATAIRKSTVNPQIMKGIKGKAPYEIQYGLAQEWKRKAKYQELFIKELCEFVQKYNAENAKLAEVGKPRRTSISTEDLNQVLSLMENDQSTELVAMLLLAFGYAKDSQENEN